MTANCAVCQKEIQAGERRIAESREYGSVTIHERCNHESPVPHFQDAEHPDTVTAETESVEIVGTIEGKGPCIDPMEGYSLSVFATEWDSLPTDQVRLVHRKKRNGWGEVWLWCNHLSVDDDTDEITDDWQNHGKVRDMSLQRD